MPKQKEDGEVSAIERKESGWTRPFRVLLSLVMILMLVAVSGTLIALDYQRGRNEAIRNADERMRIFSSQVIDRFHNLFGDSATSVGLASVADAFSSPPSIQINAKLDFLRKVATSPRVNGIYVGYPSGEFIHAVNLADARWRSELTPPTDAIVAIRIIIAGSNGERLSRWIFLSDDGNIIKELPPRPSTYDPRVRPWYRAAANGSSLISTAPYTMATTGALGITIAEAYRADKTIVIGIDVLLDTISQFLASEKISPSSTAFIMDAYRNPIIHSDPATMKILTAMKPEERATFKFGDPMIRVAQTANLPDSQTQYVSEGGRKYMVRATALSSLPILNEDKLVLITPVDELAAVAQRGLMQGVVVSAVIVMVGIAFSVFFARWITQSLQALTVGIRRFHDFDFDTPVEVRSHVREIAALVAAMTTARTTIRTFGLYVPKELVRRVISAGHFTGRAAKREEVTALFTDIYNFTTISEQREPEEVVEMLSDYFDIVSETVAEHDGAIIQFLGDSVFAMWNVPIADPEHALRACECALALQSKIDRFNTQQRVRNLSEFRTRFGIHTGTAVVGSVGAKERLQYTGMGDTVNVASRLESLNKDFNTTILVSKAVRDRCAHRLSFRHLGKQQLKGRALVVEIFELLPITA